MKKFYLRVKGQRNILHEISKRKAKWIGHILRTNCLLKRVIDGKIKGGIEVRGRRGRRRKKLLDHLKERRGYSHLKEEALDRTMWRARFGRGFGPVVRQTTKLKNEFTYKNGRIALLSHKFQYEMLQKNVSKPGLLSSGGWGCPGNYIFHGGATVWNWLRVTLTVP
jgi:hypothetical protein